MVTALFVDIIGSTEFGQDLDPEEARGIIDPALALMIDAGRYDGYVVQSTGDPAKPTARPLTLRDLPDECHRYDKINR